MLIHVDKVGMLVGSEAQKNSLSGTGTAKHSGSWTNLCVAWLCMAHRWSQKLNPFLGLGLLGSRAMSDSDGDESDLELDDLFKRRRCTDVPCCILFIVGMGALLGLFIYGCVHGNTKKLNHGIDSRGQQCGVDPMVIDRPLLYFCPVRTSQGEQSVNLDDPICVSECPGPGSNLAAGCNTPEIYPTTQVGSRYCLPSSSGEAQAREKMEESMRSNFNKVWVLLERVGKAWPVLLLSVVLACIMGYIFLFMLKTVARCIIWVCAAIGLLGFLALGAYLWSVAQKNTGSMQFTLQALAVISWVLSLLVGFLVCCCGSAVDLSTACMGQAAIVIWRMPVLLLSPLIKAVLKTVVFIVLAAGLIQLISIGDVSGMGRARHLSLSSAQIWMVVGYLFLSFWLLAFMSAVYQFSIAYAAAGWYCAPCKDSTSTRKIVNQCAVFEGVRIGLWYHTGSLAVGSALIAFLQLLQTVLEWAEKKSKMEGDLNPVTSCIVKSLLCCCKCVEGIVQFVNKNVYIDIALTSKGFCTALGSVAEIIIHHGAAMAILNGATLIFQIVGLASITACCGLVSALLLSTSKYRDITSAAYLPNPGAAIAVSCILAFIVGWAFMAIFDMTSDTLLICHAEDLQRSDGPKHTEDNKEFAEMYAKAEERAKELQAQSSDDEQPGRYSRRG